MTKLVGFLQKKGDFTNKESGEVIEYDNLELYVMTNEKEGVIGNCAYTAKAKTNELKLVGCKELKEAIGHEVYLITDLTAKPDENGKMRVLVSKLVCM